MAKPRKRKAKSATRPRAGQPAKRKRATTTKATKTKATTKAKTKTQKPKRPASKPLAAPGRAKAGRSTPGKLKPSPVATPRGKAKTPSRAPHLLPKLKPKAKARPTARPIVKPTRAQAAARRARELEVARLRKNAAARKRYDVKRGLKNQRKADRLERDRLRRELAEREQINRAGKKKRPKHKKFLGGGRRPPVIDERTLMHEWLEHCRNTLAFVFPCALTITEAGGGHAELEGAPAELAAGTPWTIVGRFEPLEVIDYQILAAGFQSLADDLLLEAKVNPQRLSQIRCVFHDPSSNRDEGDSVISKIGSWEFILGDIVGELVGSDVSDPDEGSLAERYDKTSVPVFYIFFAAELMRYVTKFGPKTQDVRMKR